MFNNAQNLDKNRRELGILIGSMQDKEKSKYKEEPSSYNLHPYESHN